MALAEAINVAEAPCAAVQAELDGTPARNALTDAEVYAMIDFFGDVGCVLKRADPARLQELYQVLRLGVIYDAEARAVDVTIRPPHRVGATPSKSMIIKTGVNTPGWDARTWQSIATELLDEAVRGGAPVTMGGGEPRRRAQPDLVRRRRARAALLAVLGHEARP